MTTNAKVSLATTLCWSLTLFHRLELPLDKIVLFLTPVHNEASQDFAIGQDAYTLYIYLYLQSIKYKT